MCTYFWAQCDIMGPNIAYPQIAHNSTCIAFVLHSYVHVPHSYVLIPHFNIFLQISKVLIQASSSVWLLSVYILHFFFCESKCSFCIIYCQLSQSFALLILKCMSYCLGLRSLVPLHKYGWFPPVLSSASYISTK